MYNTLLDMETEDTWLAMFFHPVLLIVLKCFCEMMM